MQLKRVNRLAQKQIFKFDNVANATIPIKPKKKDKRCVKRCSDVLKILTLSGYYV